MSVSDHFVGLALKGLIFMLLVLCQDINNEYVLYALSTVSLWKALSCFLNNNIIPSSVLCKLK